MYHLLELPIVVPAKINEIYSSHGTFSHHLGRTGQSRNTELANVVELMNRARAVRSSAWSALFRSWWFRKLGQSHKHSITWCPRLTKKRGDRPTCSTCSSDNKSCSANFSKTSTPDTLTRGFTSHGNSRRRIWAQNSLVHLNSFI